MHSYCGQAQPTRYFLVVLKRRHRTHFTMSDINEKNNIGKENRLELGVADPGRGRGNRRDLATHGH